LGVTEHHVPELGQVLMLANALSEARVDIKPTCMKEVSVLHMSI
jgi:hypothetical protein